jgi:hypothetical protein
LIYEENETKNSSSNRSSNSNKLRLSDSLFLINESDKNTSNGSLNDRFNKNQQVQISTKKSNNIQNKINKKMLNQSNSENSKFKCMSKEKSSENLKITSKMKRSQSLDPNTGLIETNVSTLEELIEEKTIFKKKIKDSQQLNCEEKELRLLNKDYLQQNMIRECELDHTPSKSSKNPLFLIKNYKSYDLYKAEMTRNQKL